MTKFQTISKFQIIKAFQKCSSRAFTLLELLLVIAIISVLAALVIFNLRPADVLQDANNVKNEVNSKDIKKAIEAYVLDHDGNLPTSLQGQTSGEYTICKQSEVSCPVGSISLDELITAGYLSTIPVNENLAGEKTTGYAIEYDATKGTVEIIAGELIATPTVVIPPPTIVSAGSYTYTTSSVLGSATTYENYDITVNSGVTVTMWGSHTFASVTVLSGGIIDVGQYGEAANTTRGSLSILANNITVSGTGKIDAYGRGYGGGGGGGGAWNASAGGSTGNLTINGIVGGEGGSGGPGGAGGGYGGGGGGVPYNSIGIGSMGGGNGGVNNDWYDYNTGGGGGGSGNGTQAFNGSYPTGGLGIGGGGNGGNGTWGAGNSLAGSGGGGGGGPFGGNGGNGASGASNGFTGIRGGYLSSQSNGDSSIDFSINRGSGGGGGGGGGGRDYTVGGTGGAGGNNGGVGRTGAYGVYSVFGIGGGGGGGAAGGGAIKLEASQYITVSGQLIADGAGKAELNGGFGAGGGIALKAPILNLTGATIRTLGGNMTGAGVTTNGGTIKVFTDSYSGLILNTTNFPAGRVYSSTYI
ncbi:type II secretion system protein [Candidatus Dojkabacteria bacterium]|nr:type II secretion system protein [Candidatus Dojkabacteria bacterium]